MASFVDLSGQRFGRLVILSLSNPSRYKGNTYWDCRCDCGKIVAVRPSHLRSGTKSCGCLRQKMWENMKINNPALTIPDETKKSLKSLVGLIPDIRLAKKLKFSRNTVKKYRNLLKD